MRAPGLSVHAPSPFRAVAILLSFSILLAIIPTMSVVAQESEGTPPPLAGESDSGQPCFDGRLRIRDLEQADSYIPEGLERVYSVGREWEEDAALYSLRLGCPLLETGYQLEGTFFSKTAQAFYSTDTSEIRATDDDPNSIPILDTSQGVEVLFVYRSLVRAGFDEDSALGGLGVVTIRPSTDEQPFGPPTAPRPDVYFHVSIQERGEIVDVWVASKDGTIYRYQAE
jgi:hypothetical protein